jgi:hypothetical protein
VGSRDYQEKTVQYIYGNPAIRSQVTHIHHPKEGRTQQLYYDNDNLLVAIESVDSRHYVATDESSSPIAVFDNLGKLVKQLGRTPFGRTMHDSNPNFDLSLLIGLLFINLYVNILKGSSMFFPRPSQAGVIH